MLVVSVSKHCCVCVLLIALFVSVDRRITLKSLKAALEPHIGTSVDNFKVLLSFCALLCLWSLLSLCKYFQKVFWIGTVRYNWPMSAHASQAFSIAHCSESEDLSYFLLSVYACLSLLVSLLAINLYILKAPVVVTMFVSVPVCPSVCLPACLSTCLFLCLSLGHCNTDPALSPARWLHSAVYVSCIWWASCWPQCMCPGVPSQSVGTRNGRNPSFGHAS